jgi:hypothetical protein
VVRRRLLGEKRGSFPLKGSNWFSRPVVHSLAAWREDLRLLEDVHRSLRAAVSNLEPSGLHRCLPSGTVTPFDLLSGIAAHDVYHAGQIQLLKRLSRGRDRRSA